MKDYIITNQKINYSFICPHHNNPDLLKRLIDTIPVRPDIEIIVVDDNSDCNKRPLISRSNLKIITIDAEHTKGPGKARNVGMSEANGKWFLFPDSDDYYELGFIELLDKYVGLDIDMVCFDVYYAYDIEIGKERWPNKYSESIKKYFDSGGDIYYLRTIKHIIQAPWNFMIKKEIVVKNKILFEEIPKGNDARFHHVASQLCKKVEVCPEKLYYWIWNPNSITHQNFKKEYRISQLQHFAYITQYRINANAWNTIPPFTQGIKEIFRQYGLSFGVKYMLCKISCGVPWHMIWWHKLCLICKKY